MLQKVLSTLFLIGVIACVAQGESLPECNGHFDWHPIDAPPIDSTDEAFTGLVNGVPVVVALSGDIFALPDASSTWQKVGNLPHPPARGISAVWRDSIILIGGDDDRSACRHMQMLSWNGEKRQAHVEIMPDLPRACDSAGATVLGDVLYVFLGSENTGGNYSTTSAESAHAMWTMDLAQPPESRKWSALESLPDAAMGKPLLVAQDRAVYMLGSSRRVHRFDPKRGWSRIADLPQDSPVTAAIPFGQSHLLALGRRISAYHTITDTWVTSDFIPKGFHPQSAVAWENGIGILGTASDTGRTLFYRVVLNERISQLTWIDYLTVGGYFLALVFMGVFFSKRTKSTGDFFLAGRRVPWWVAGISIRATQISSIGFLAMPAKAYATNWSYLAGVLTIPLIAPLVIHFYLPFFRRLDVTSAYEYLEKRFNVAVRMFGSIAFVVFQLARIGVVLFLPSLAISAVTGVDIYLCILAAGLICTFYTVLGGIEAVMWTDLLQEIILFGGPLLCLILAIAGTDGGLWGYASLGNADGKFQMIDWNFDLSLPTIYVILLGFSLINLSTYTSDQAVVQRYLTTKSEQQAVRAIWLNAAFAVPWGVLCFMLGAAFYTFYKTNPGMIEIGAETDKILPLFVAQQLPSGMAGLILAALCAATMSTVDSGMHSTATVIVTDFFRRFQAFQSDGAYLKLARWVTVLLGLFGTGVALLMATYDIKSLWDLFISACALLGSGLGGLFALGIFTRRAHGIGALVGAFSSSVILYLVQQYTDIHFFLYAAVGFVSCFTVGYICSCLLPATKRNLAGLTVFDFAARND